MKKHRLKRALLTFGVALILFNLFTIIINPNSKMVYAEEPASQDCYKKFTYPGQWWIWDCKLTQEMTPCSQEFCLTYSKEAKCWVSEDPPPE